MWMTFKDLPGGCNYFFNCCIIDGDLLYFGGERFFAPPGRNTQSCSPLFKNQVTYGRMRDGQMRERESGANENVRGSEAI